ncbi:prolipoprotein diacylglyceryl transferase [Arthrobacter sp. UM1]|uniref:prolipoprotein diacylglyceryl transferase n=1 Tax=Arthrobacter sp. UM1 TaxID=2766776 RepID=UPI001CF60B46|nr:prolipoprotein diacylglyceryl transferase [Arthrobacter sp. UM1]MCB4207619.1 prolipoprotein diacylglyceryl transferase [Arthrobacter sp. UM1]
MLLAAIPSPGVNGFNVGPLRIHFYALCIIVGIVLALWITARRLRARGVNPEVVYDLGMWCVPFGIIGGRAYHVVSHWPDYFGPGKDLSDVFKIWEGGLAIMGAITLGAVGAWIGCRRSGLKMSAFADAAAPGLLVAQAMGRWGNWFNQELFGGPTTLPWGLRIDPASPNFPAGLPADTLFHPTFLYEMLWNLAGALFIVLLDRRLRFRHGSAFWLYVMVYSFGRYLVEHIRIDPAVHLTVLGIDDRINSWAAVLIFLIGLVGFLVTVRRTRRERRDAGRLASAASHGSHSPEAREEALEEERTSLEAGSPFSRFERARSRGIVLDDKV